MSRKKKKEKYTLFDNFLFLIAICFVVYIVGFSDYALFKYYDYSQVDNITKEDITKIKK